MKRTGRLLMTAVITAFCLAGCAGISSESYSAVGFTHGNTKTSAYMDFRKFKGNMNFTLSANEDERIHYSASLEEGSAVVYKRTEGKKEELFRLEAGEDVDSSFAPEPGEVNLEFVADGTCREGKVRFEIEEEL